MCMIECLSDLQRPEIKSRVCGGTSEEKRRERSIRQGCRLSPYRFLLVMTVVFHDAHENDSETKNGKIDFLTCLEILYADDTLLVTKDTKSAKRYVDAIKE